MLNLSELKEKLDIDLLGVIKAEPMKNIFPLLKERKEKGYVTTFEDENLEARIDPSFHLENSKSIFVIGMSYIHDVEKNGFLKISNHARGLDYHKVLKNRLEELEEELKKDFHFSSYLQVDSGSLFEKEMGRRAGFGYIGKNSLLINEKYGSYIFLGILVTDIELENYSKPTTGSCGDCHLCVDVCPANAIFGNYKIDSSHCHSYLSQWRKEIEETKNLKYVYGCDICQEICPKNKDILRNIHAEFRPRIINFDDIDIDEYSNRKFKKAFRDYSFSWVGKKVIKRNIQILKE